MYERQLIDAHNMKNGHNLNGIFEVGRTITLYDLMNKFDTKSLFQINKHLEDLRTDVERGYKDDLSEDDIELNVMFLGNLVSLADSELMTLLGHERAHWVNPYFLHTKSKIEEATKYLRRLVDKEGFLRKSIGLNIKHLREATSYILAIREAFKKDCQDNLFIIIDSSKSQFYNNSEPFGAAIHKAFEKHNYDIVNAHKCFALGQNDAAVHLAIGVVEKEVRALGKKFSKKWAGVKSLDWGGITDQISAQMKNWTGFKKGSIEERHKDKVHALVTALAHLNKAYRTYSAHRKTKFAANDAIRVFDYCRSSLEEIKIFNDSRVKLPIIA